MTSTYTHGPDWFTGHLATARGTGSIGDADIEFTAVHREENTSPVTTSLTMTVPVSLADLEGALWIVVSGGMTFDELTDDVFLHQLILETVFAEGGHALDAARNAMARVKPGSLEHSAARQVRERIQATYGQAVPEPRRASRTRRSLATVG